MICETRAAACCWLDCLMQVGRMKLLTAAPLIIIITLCQGDNHKKIFSWIIRSSSPSFSWGTTSKIRDVGLSKFVGNNLIPWNDSFMMNALVVQMWRCFIRRESIDEKPLLWLSVCLTFIHSVTHIFCHIIERQISQSSKHQASSFP